MDVTSDLEKIRSARDGRGIENFSPVAAILAVADWNAWKRGRDF